MSYMILVKHYRQTPTGVLIAEHWREEIDDVDGSRVEYEGADYFLERAGELYTVGGNYFIQPDEWVEAAQQIEADLEALHSREAQDRAIAEQAENYQRHVAWHKANGSTPKPKETKNA